MSCELAIWFPFWYELDQSLEVGTEKEFAFFRVAPPHVPIGSLPVFFFGLGEKKDYYLARKRIIAIRHPLLGDIQEIQARGLCYKFILSDGRELNVEAEESPGVVYGFDKDITDWRIYVEMESLE
jgi:hypothetical protein